MIWFLLACAKPEMPEASGRLPDFALVDQAGKPAALGDWSGKVWVADFMFTSCPDICPILSARMAALAGHYRTDDRVRFVSISVDPLTDTPEVLSRYAARYGADTRWRFLTGETAAVRKVVVEGFKQLMDRAPAGGPDPGSILHGSRFVVVDGGGEIRGFPDPEVPGEIEGVVDVVLAAQGRG